MAARRHGVHDRRARPRRAAAPTSSATTRRPARELLVLSTQLIAAGPKTAARHRRLRLVGRRQAAADLHQHEEGVAAEHARRLLGARHHSGGALKKLGGDAPDVVADVCQVLARRHARRLRARQQHLRRAASTTARSRQLTQRRYRRRSINGTSDWVYEEELGRARLASAGAPTASRIAYWQFDTHRRRHLHADQRHRSALPGDHEDSRIRRPARRTRRSASASSAPTAAATTVDQDARRSARHLSGPHRTGWTRDTVAIQQLNRLQNQQRLPARRRRATAP